MLSTLTMSDIVEFVVLFRVDLFETINNLQNTFRKFRIFLVQLKTTRLIVNNENLLCFLINIFSITR